MNTNLVTIVKQIAAQYGEAVLADPARLKAFFSDLAKDEPKPLRIAFGRCIEARAYDALKNAPDKSERSKRKAAIAQRVRDEHGLDMAISAEALDILEAALYGVQSTMPPQTQPPQQPQYTPPKPAGTSPYVPPQAGVTPAAANAAPAGNPAKKKSQTTGLIVVWVVASAIIVLMRDFPFYDPKNGSTKNPPYSENAASSPADTVNAFFNQGVSYYNEKEYDQAIAAFNKALELDPNHASALAYRGGSYRYKENYNSAVADCTAALEIDPQDAIAWFHRGSAYYLKGDNNRGIEDLTEAIRLNSTNADAYNNRGGAYRNKGDYDRAIADYTEALKLAPNNAVIKNNLADARNRQAQSKTRQEAANYINSGIAYIHKDLFDAAIADLTQAIRLDPNNAKAYAYRGDAYGWKEDWDRAIADCTQAIRLDPNNAKAYTERGYAYRGKKMYDQAITDLTQAIRLDPNNDTGYLYRGYAYNHKGDYTRAIADFETALQLDPNNATARESLQKARNARGW